MNEFSLATIKDFFLNMLFTLEWTTLPDALKKALFFLVCCVLTLWLIWLLITKVFFAKSTIHRDVLLHLNLLRSFIIFQFVFCIYLFYLIRFSGLEKFEWANFDFYLLIAPQLLVFAGIIVLYYNYHNSFSKMLNPKNSQ